MECREGLLKCCLPHPKTFPVGYSQNFFAFRTEVYIPFAKETLQTTTPDPGQLLGAMGANWIHVLFFFNG